MSTLEFSNVQLRHAYRGVALSFTFSMLLASCGGGGGDTPQNPVNNIPGVTTYNIGGTVSGLAGTGGGMVLNNYYENLVINGNGNFTFATAVYSGFPYSVTVTTQPTAPAQVCAVNNVNASGTVSGTVSNVQVVCTNTISFTMSGLYGSAVLQNNGGDNITVNNNGTYTFSQKINTGSLYSVTVLSATVPQQCNFTNGSGTASGNVTNILVHCVNTIAGTMVGLTGTVVLQNNGADNLTRTTNGAFTFAIPVETGSTYFVSVFSQPIGQTCLVTDNAQSTAYGNVTNVVSACANGQWTWMSGSSSSNQTGTYGTKGTASALNMPGARYEPVGWSDTTNGYLWLFGGHGYAASVGAYLSEMNDLWRYNIATGQWTWVSGSNTYEQNGVYGTKGTAAANNIPGSRSASATWLQGGYLWLLGGNARSSTGAASMMNDLWRYNPATNQWTWMHGSDLNDNLSAVGVYGTKGTAASGNVPGGRRNAASWVDGSGNLWLFGGYGRDVNSNAGLLNDLWRYNPATNQWTWMSGSNITSQGGTYGAQGVANASNVPGGRSETTAWFDATNGNLWLFGGNGYAASTAYTDNLNDLWKYNITSGLWTWVSGSDLGGQTAVYGTLGVANANNTPSARNAGTGQIDSGGNLWVYGGDVSYGAESDFWKFNITSGQWTWMSGSKFINQSTAYGTLGVAATGMPGSREMQLSWIDTNDNLWFFGGYDGGHRNDLWRFK